MNEPLSPTVKAPAPTAWPIVMAFGFTTLAAGLVTAAAVSILGAVLVIAGAIGWFRAVMPHEDHEELPVDQGEPQLIATRRLQVNRIKISAEVHRAWLPLEVYPTSAGVKGGLGGSVMMAILASTFGLLKFGSVWYPINLLVAGFFPEAVNATVEQLVEFHMNAFLIAVPLHLLMSLMVGLLYGAMLPMLPRRPVLLGGFIAPFMWSGLIYGILGIVNPVLEKRINWFWFVLSQVGFGIVAGIIVSRQEKIRTWQGIPFSVRVGMDASGMRDNGEDKE